MSRRLVLSLFVTLGCAKPTLPPSTLPKPDGSSAVGVVPLTAFYLTAYYPAIKGSGSGPRGYASQGLLQTLKVDHLDVTSSAELNAEPVGDRPPSPVVIFAPGGSSYVELSTSLAEQLASHGFVVVLVQPNAEEENGGRGSLGSDPAAARVALAGSALRLARLNQVSQAIDLLRDPMTAKLVGPIDSSHIAVGGHSYGGSTAFNASLTDSRITAVFDLDGTLFEDANTTPTRVPSLVVMATMYQFSLNPDAGTGSNTDAESTTTLSTLRANPKVVAVALRDADHYDVTDVAAIAPSLPSDFRPSSHIGTTATAQTNTIVVRFLAAALGSPARLPTSGELSAELASAVAPW